MTAQPDSLPHIPVLLEEVLEGLHLSPGMVIVDGTLGAGGHSEAILNVTAPDGLVFGFDRDETALLLARDRLAKNGDRLIAVHRSYADMGAELHERDIDKVDGVLLDLGYSSMQIDDPARGFSFQYDSPLDMRFDTTGGETASDLANDLSEEALANLIYEYGEERRSRRIARAIVAARPISTTGALAAIVSKATPRSRDRIHPATRTFQALRIAVNDELGALERALPQTLELLAPGGRLCVISFHSLEDRIVKRFIRAAASDCVCPPEQPVCTCDTMPTLRKITRKPIRASETEIIANPRARSAKLRVAERV